MAPDTAPAADGYFINVRKLAALDLVFHGPRFILIEFALPVLVFGPLGLVLLALGLFAGHAPVVYQIVAGAFFLWMGLNYLPLWLYAMDIARRGSARTEVAYELEHADYFKRKYGIQQFLLVLPLAIPVLAIIQERRRRAQSGRGVQ